MRRVHAFELEDQPWLPRTIRDFATDFLRFMIDLGESYAPVVPLVRQALGECGSNRIVDLGSGGGGPWLRLLGRLNAEGPPVRVLLTDKYPNREAVERVRGRAGEGLAYHSEPVDAMQIPPDLGGFRTLFTALHHFRPEEARAILADAVRKGHGIGVFEFSERSARGLLMTSISPLLVLLFTPLIRPFRWSRLFWTYAVPVVPLVVLWDGMVSCLRTYTPEEMRAMAESVTSGDYVWESGTVRGRSPAPVSYLVGYPASRTRASASTDRSGARSGMVSHA